MFLFPEDFSEVSYGLPVNTRILTTYEVKGSVVKFYFTTKEPLIWSLNSSKDAETFERRLKYILKDSDAASL